MKSKNTKIIVDIFMAVFLILSFVRWDNSNFAFHAIVGLGCTVFFVIHVFIHKRWLKATTKSCFAGKLSRALRGKYIIDISLLIVWSASIVAGFIAIAPFFGEAHGGFLWGRLHGITARIALAFVIIHIVQHIPQIKSYLGIKRQAKGVN